MFGLGQCIQACGPQEAVGAAACARDDVMGC